MDNIGNVQKSGCFHNCSLRPLKEFLGKLCQKIANLYQKVKRFFVPYPHKGKGAFYLDTRSVKERPVTTFSEELNKGPLYFCVKHNGCDFHDDNTHELLTPANLEGEGVFNVADFNDNVKITLPCCQKKSLGLK